MTGVDEKLKDEIKPYVNFAESRKHIVGAEISLPVNMFLDIIGRVGGYGEPDKISQCEGYRFVAAVVDDVVFEWEDEGETIMYKIAHVSEIKGWDPTSHGPGTRVNE